MLPYLIHIGSFSLPTYEVLVATAFLAALAMASHFARQRGINHEKIVNLGVYCALVGMAGAKVLMIVLDPEYRSNPVEIFSLATLQSAGIFYGGFIAALVFAWFYMKKQGLPVFATSDLFAPGLAIGHGIGRLGCFAAGCCWGKPTNLPWAVTFTNTSATTGVPLGIALHPTQLLGPSRKASFASSCSGSSGNRIAMDRSSGSICCSMGWCGLQSSLSATTIR